MTTSVPLHRPLTDKAFEWAASAHAGQVDKIGEPYLGHVRRVSEAAWHATQSDEAAAVGLLHDIVEDTHVTLDQLRQTGFPERVVEAVDAMTKRKGESFADYYERVKANDLAVIVKWHDVADNADPRRLAKVAPDTQERLRSKYERARALLSPAPAACAPTPEQPKCAGQEYLQDLYDNGSPRLRKIARDLLDQTEGLFGVERLLDRMATRSVLEGWRWWRPSWSAGYHQGLTDAWQVAFDALLHELQHAADEEPSDA